MKSHLVFVLTTRCNYRCKHCIRDYYSRQADLSLSIAKKVLKEARELGFKHVALTGGEPGMHPEFDQMVDLICSHGLTWSAVTNGSVYERYAPAIKAHEKECTFISVSLDGLEKNHDAIRMNGSFHKALEALDFFRKNSLYTKIAFTLNAQNFEELAEIVALAEQKKVHEVRVAAIIPNRFNQHLKLTWEQKLSAYKFITENQDKHPVKLTFTTSLYTVSDADAFCANINDPEPAINPYGDYIFCCDTNGAGAVVGSLKKEGFSSLFIKQLKLAASLKEQRRQMIQEEKCFDDFNSCHFCNTLLESKIRKDQP